MGYKRRREREMQRKGFEATATKKGWTKKKGMGGWESKMITSRYNDLTKLNGTEVRYSGGLLKTTMANQKPQRFCNMIGWRKQRYDWEGGPVDDSNCVRRRKWAMRLKRQIILTRTTNKVVEQRLPQGNY